ncbi:MULTISPECIES: cytidine deaminase [Thermus]|jgi:cytidine deaminase|uniref:Cytidine deaminase n=1 Tax=Thermus aquaticus (strain ATCC BAA-2747 / Y51MC23) TaxID=498848 RepID=A0ABM5VK56_THEA5|nr:MULTISPECIES: cytidine deaminase [Thermus]ALJ90533.1 cytidine deaminase [Thermus aquaticus Y51MC23]MDT7908736.1 cytidine deaminase [Thermus sp.]MDT7921531.1 cytidine deaminase [Thermus sp.]
MERIKALLQAHVERAYAPYSGFPVVALVEAEGEAFLGVNVENAAFPLSQCAERNAVAAMVLAGKRRIDRVHVYSPKGPIPPCGGCRQVLMEFGGPEVEVVLHGPEGEEVTTLGALLPMAFRL